MTEIKVEKHIAERVSQEVLFCSGKLDESIALVQGIVGKDFFHHYRRKVGGIMGLLYLDLLRDVYAEHPDLEPESIK